MTDRVPHPSDEFSYIIILGLFMVLIGMILWWRFMEWFFEDDGSPFERLFEFLWKHSTKLFLILTAAVAFTFWRMHV